MSTKLTYNCKLCGKPGETHYDETMVHRLERWVSILHCNRCADFRSMLRKLRENAQRIVIIRWQLQKAGKATKETEERVRNQIASLTKAIAELVCVHWRIEVVWEQDFAEQLLDFPDKAEFIVNQYANMIKEQAAQAHAQAMLALSQRQVNQPHND